jgi:hypothetical protein
MNEDQLEDALHDWPLAETPVGFTSGVMERITPRQTYVQISNKSELKFRLTWMDFALGIFFSSLPLLGLVAFLSLPQKVVLYLQYQWLMLQFPAFDPVPLTFVGMILILFALVILLSLRSIFPRELSLF